MAHLLLSGYFGAGNVGDDAIMLGFVQGLSSKANVEITVLSGSPEETHRNYGFNAVQRKDFNAIKDAIDRCDALVYPGGSIFQDVTSVKSALYYEKIVGMAKSKKKKIFLVGQGVGPLNSFFGKRAAASAFNDADGIAVRDPGSVSTLQSLGVKKPARITADSAFLLPPPPEKEAMDFSVGNMKTVGISIRPHGKDKDVVSLFGDLCRMLFQNNYMPVLIEMDREADGPLILEISKKQGGKIPDLRKLNTPMQLQQRLSRMDAVIAMRLHAGILATTVGIPPLMVSYDPKVAAFSKMLDMSSSLSIEGLTAQRVYDAFIQHQKDRERNVKILERKREEFRAAAMGNVTLVAQGLGL